MSKKLLRSVQPGKKIHISDDRPLPEAADELIPLNYHPFGEKVQTFSLTELERNLPRPPSAESQASLKSAEYFSQQASYYEHNDTDDGSNVWDEYWFPCGSESSDLSQSAASFMSWTDEIEVETTKKLQQSYDDLESFLYGEGPPPANASAELIDECRLWNSKFPHLRVLGTAIRPPTDFRTSSSLRITEEILAIDESDSDDETIQDSPKPTFLEFDEATDRFLYDDVTMGTQCEADRKTLRGRVDDSVMTGLFTFVATKLAESRDDVSSRQLDHWIAPPERSATSVSATTANIKVVPRAANSSSSSRLAVRPPTNVDYEPSETRAYHSAAIRVQSRAAPARRLHSFAGHDLAPGRLPSRQDAILRELRESQRRLGGTGSGTGDGVGREKPRSTTWSGGRHAVLPPLETRLRVQDKVNFSPRDPSASTIQVNGTGLPRPEPREVTLKKYSPLGGSSTTLTKERRKLGRL